MDAGRVVALQDPQRTFSPTRIMPSSDVGMELSSAVGDLADESNEAATKAAKKAARHAQLLATRNKMGIGNAPRCNAKTFEIARNLFQRLYLLL